MAGVATTPAIDRLLDRVVRLPFSGCWIFMGATTDFGHGLIGGGGRGARTLRTHRVAYEHFNGPITSGLFVCHHCDVPSCCNPDHLFLGTNAENMEDCRRKGRDSKPPANDHIKGSVHVAHKLVEDDIPKIKSMHASGMSQTAIALAFNVSSTTIFRVVHNERWRHVQ